MKTSQTVILCEGYDDRAFWAGWLNVLGCRDARHKGQAVDPWSEPVRGGQYAYQTPSDHFVRVHPCDGRERISKTAKLYIGRHAARPLCNLLLNFDADVDAPADGDKNAVLTSVLAQCKPQAEPQAEPQAKPQAEPQAEPQAGAANIDGAAVSTIMWSCSDPADRPGIPLKQTLERLITAAIVAAYPPRGPSVRAWLEDQPETVGPLHKAYGYAHLAKWYGEHGCADFYQNVWRDAAVREQLERRLHQTGAWQVVQSMIGEV